MARLFIIMLWCLVAAGCGDGGVRPTSARGPQCPQCSGDLIVVPMVVGLPSKSMVDALERGEVLLAGCVGDPDNPEKASVCLACRHWKTREMTLWQDLPLQFGTRTADPYSPEE